MEADQFNAKVLLFGEYAVLHEGMALVIPWNKYSGKLDFYSSARKGGNLAVQSNEYLKKFCEFVSSHMDQQFILEVKRFEKELEQGLFFQSTIPQGYGLGSSGALVAAIVLRYLVKAKNLKDELKELTFKKLKDLKKNLGNLEAFFHGASSGLDPLSIILNEPVLYKNSKDIVTTHLPSPSEEGNNVIFLLDTKSPRTTAKMMRLFDRLYAKEQFKKEFQKNVLENNNGAINNLLNADLDSFYHSVFGLSSFQLKYMKDFFPKKIHGKVAEGLNNGDYFLKICGAGGGGFLLGFTQSWEKAQEELGAYTLEEIYRY